MAGSVLATGFARTGVAQKANLEAEILPLADWRYEELHASGISVEDLIGSGVKGPKGDYPSSSDFEQAS